MNEKGGTSAALFPLHWPRTQETGGRSRLVQSNIGPIGDASMKSDSETKPGRIMEENRTARNPFGVADVPSPNDQEATTFAAGTTLDGSADDANADGWNPAGNQRQRDSIEGPWSSRWNGGADPTIPGDASDQWKPGAAEARAVGERVYLRFDWNHGARKGLIDAQRDGSNRLVGKYLNLTDPTIIRP
jgi:hypothetical protein